MEVNCLDNIHLKNYNILLYCDIFITFSINENIVNGLNDYNNLFKKFINVININKINKNIIKYFINYYKKNNIIKYINLKKNIIINDNYFNF